MTDIPIELINLILSYREKHPIRNIICCLYCKEEGECLHVYHRGPVKSSSPSSEELVLDEFVLGEDGIDTSHVTAVKSSSEFRKFEIICSDCNHDFCKD